MTVTEDWFDGLSSEQQAVLIEDTQEDPMLMSSFEDDGGPSLSFNQFEFNGSVDSITEMEVEISYIGLGSEIPFTVLGVGGQVETKVLDFSAQGGFGGGMYGDDLSFTVAMLEVSYGPVSGSVTAGDVGAGTTIGNPDGSHLSAGVGLGVGAGAGASTCSRGEATLSGCPSEAAGLLGF